MTNRYDNDQGEDIVCEYDDAGNTIEDHRGYHYQYDYENRIIRIYKMDGQDEIEVAQYDYDALGRRIEKVQYDNYLDTAADVTTTQYYYNDNWQVLSEYENFNPRIGSDTDAERDYLYGNYLDEAGEI